MKPVCFEGANTVYAEHQDPYRPLPAFYDEKANGRVVSCWSLSFRERLRLLITGEVWLTMLTFGKPLQPVKLTTKLIDDFTIVFD